MINCLLDRLSQISPLNEQEQSDFQNSGSLKQVLATEHLFRTGDTPTQLRFVVSGVLCKYYIKTDGTRRNKSFLQAGDIAACLSSMHTGQPARFSCEILQDAQVFEVPYAKLQQLAKQSAAWQQIMTVFITRLALKKEAREADLLLLSASELYQQFIQQSPELVKTLPNYHVASYLGVTEVSLSRIRAKLGMQNPYTKAC